jgi:hypothetical protein
MKTTGRSTGRGDDEGNTWYEVRLREGRNQQIRKMFKAVGHPVSKLRRVAIGPIADPKLTPGDWRELTRHEVKLLATLQEMPKPKAKPKAKPRRAAAARPATSKKKAAANAASNKKSKSAGVKRTAPARRRAASTAREPRRGRG